VLRDADQLHAEGSAFKFYNAEFKVDVYFAAPENLGSFASKPGDDMAEVYLKTQVGCRTQMCFVAGSWWYFTHVSCMLCIHQLRVWGGLAARVLDIMVELHGWR
jgi:hypothetical protein